MVFSVSNALRAALILLLAAADFAQAESRRELAKGVSFGAYESWPRSVVLSLDQPGVEAVLTPNAGGRILRYSLDGDSPLLDYAPADWQSPEGGRVPFPAGGYQCDVGPEIRELPPHPALWMGTNSWQYKPYMVKLMSDPCDALGVQVEKEVLLDRETGSLALTQRLRNTSDETVSYCLWDRTFCKPGGFAFFPLNKKSRFKQGWTVHSVWNNSFRFDGKNFVSDEVKTVDDHLVIFCHGEATKVGADSDAEWIAYVRGDLLFVKFFPYFPKGDYSDGGNTVEVYFDKEMAEIQVLSPEVALRPNENYSFPEKWVLIRLDKPVGDFKEVRKLAKKIPPSPFKK